MEIEGNKKKGYVIFDWMISIFLWVLNVMHVLFGFL